MYNLTKEQVKVRLFISFILGVLISIALYFITDIGEQLIIVCCLAPLLLTLSIGSIIFYPKEFLKNVILKEIYFGLFLITFRVIDAFGNLADSFKWNFKLIWQVIKMSFWAFSSKE